MGAVLSRLRAFCARIHPVFLASALLLLQSATAPRLFDAWLETPGGELDFGLELLSEGGCWMAVLVNGEERIEVPRVTCDGPELLLELPHYDSRLRARFVPELVRATSALDGTRREETVGAPRACLEGTWEKRRSASASARLVFRAVERPPESAAAPAPAADGAAARAFEGRWAVDFASDDEPAVAVFHAVGAAGEVRGTVLTTTGDYRYLAGRADAGGLTLSCFDGAHAFLLKAQRLADGTLAGDFHSGDWHDETWTAVRDATAELPDGFSATRARDVRLADLTFPDLDGKTRSLGEFGGRATLLVVFGSWCPNCNDEAAFLAELDRRYRERGLCILGLAFELTGEAERDAGQVRIFAQRHGLAIPYFLCGTADKDEATRALGLLDRVRAFPTTVFVGADGRVRAVHSGYAGPATGEEHQRLRRAFVGRIEALLAETPAK